jgi:hypothetical protein
LMPKEFDYVVGPLRGARRDLQPSFHFHLRRGRPIARPDYLGNRRPAPPKGQATEGLTAGCGGSSNPRMQLFQRLGQSLPEPRVQRIAGRNMRPAKCEGHRVSLSQRAARWPPWPSTCSRPTRPAGPDRAPATLTSYSWACAPFTRRTLLTLGAACA